MIDPADLRDVFDRAASLPPQQRADFLARACGDVGEARRLMLTSHINAAAAAFQVGYESASQFSREYSRQFGVPPRTDVLRLMGGREGPTPEVPTQRAPSGLRVARSS